MFNFKYGILGKNNKFDSYAYYYKTLQNRINSIFVFKKLPLTINKDFLNNNLINLGFSAFFRIGDSVYTGWGGLGGEPTHEYKPSVFTYSNPVLGSHNFLINQDNPEDDEAIIMYNSESDEQFINFTDCSTGGFSRLLHQTATLLTDNLLSINMAQINTRVQAVFTAENQHQKNGAVEVLKKLYNGEPFNVLLSDDLSPFTVNEIAGTGGNEISRLIEVHQHIISDFYNEVGIPMTPYFKKERMINAEVDGYSNISNSILSTLYDSRNEAIKRINEKYGLGIEVDYSDWVKELIEDNNTNYGNDLTDSSEEKENDNKNSEESEASEGVKDDESDKLPDSE